MSYVHRRIKQLIGLVSGAGERPDKDYRETNTHSFRSLWSTGKPFLHSRAARRDSAKVYQRAETPARPRQHLLPYVSKGKDTHALCEVHSAAEDAGRPALSYCRHSISWLAGNSPVRDRRRLELSPCSVLELRLNGGE